MKGEMQIGAIAASGLRTAESALDRSAAGYSSASAGDSKGGAARDSVSLSSAAVNLLQAKNDFGANLAAFKVGDDMTKDAIDLIG